MGTHPIFESDFDCLTDMVCVPCIVIPVVLWIYQNYLRSYLEPVLGPILGPILKPIYAKIEPYIGKYVPNSDSTEAKCPVSGKSSSSDNASCPGDVCSLCFAPLGVTLKIKKSSITNTTNDSL